MGPVGEYLMYGSAGVGALATGIAGGFVLGGGEAITVGGAWAWTHATGSTGLRMAAAGTGAMLTRLKGCVSGGGDGAGSNLVKVGEWTLDPKVSRHLGDVAKSGDLVRPYLNSPYTLQEIMAAGKPIADPRGFPGAVRYDVPGAFRGSQGTFELVIHPESKTVLPWLFRSGP